MTARKSRKSAATGAETQHRVMSIEMVIAELEGANLEQLREEWRRRYGAPPPLRSIMLLRYVLAWRMQADVFGGLDEQTRNLLRDA